MQIETKKAPTFIRWFRGPKDRIEKAFGLIVLFAEVVIFALDFGDESAESKLFISQLLNFVFLAFIGYRLRADFDRSYWIDPKDDETIEVLNLPPVADRTEEVSKLNLQANILLQQFRTVIWFFWVTSLLYLWWLIEFGLKKVYGLSILPGYSHLIAVILSYGAALFLLRCFYVLFETTLDDDNKSVLRRNTFYYVFPVFFLIALDFLHLDEAEYRIFFEFVCGVTNAVVFILFVTRFHNKIMGIPSVVISGIYLYAVLQTCLLIVTPDVKTIVQEKFIHDIEVFANIILILCLAGKIVLSVVLLYVLDTRRIIYYFMVLRLLHQKEGEYWQKFYNGVTSQDVGIQPLYMVYTLDEKLGYIARFYSIFRGKRGVGRTPAEAKRNLLEKLASPSATRSQKSR